MNDLQKLKELNLIISHGVFFPNTVEDEPIRDKIFQWLAERALYILQEENSDKLFTFEQIREKILSLLKTNYTYEEIQIPEELIDTGIRKSINDGIIIEENQMYYIPNKRVEEIKLQIELVEKEKDELLNYFIDKITEFIDLAEPDIITVKSVILETLFEFIDDQCFHVMEMLENNELVLDDNELLNDKDDNYIREMYANKIKEKLCSNFPNELTKVQIIINAFFDSVKYIPDEKAQYLLKIFNTIIYHKILRKDPELKKFQDGLLKERIIYLDDNVVIAAILESHLDNKIVKQLLKDCRKLGIDLRISPEVKDEVESSFKAAKLIFHDKEKTYSEKIRHNIVREYIEYYLLKDIDWDSFEKYYLPLEDNFCKEFGVNISDECFDRQKIKDNDNFYQIFNVFEDNKNYKRYQYNREDAKYETIEHDVINYLHIHLLRKKYQPDVLGQKVYFISLDKCLRISQMNLKYYYKYPYSRHIEEFLGFLLPYKVNISNELSKESYISYMIKSDLNLMDKCDFKDLLDYFSRRKINIKKLLVKEPQVIEEIITEAQIEMEIQNDNANANIIDNFNVDELLEKLQYISQKEKHKQEKLIKEKDMVIESLKEENKKLISENEQDKKRIKMEIEKYREETEKYREETEKLKRIIFTGCFAILFIIIIVFIILFK